MDGWSTSLLPLLIFYLSCLFMKLVNVRSFRSIWMPMVLWPARSGHSHASVDQHLHWIDRLMCSHRPSHVPRIQAPTDRIVLACDPRGMLACDRVRLIVRDTGRRLRVLLWRVLFFFFLPHGNYEIQSTY